MAKANRMRLFVALDLPTAVQQSLGSLTRQLDQSVPPRHVRWVKPDLLHLTLRFLGETAVSRLPYLTKALDEVAAEQRPFSLALDRLGAFPNRKRPRIIWMGLTGELAPLQALKQALDTALVPLGWPPQQRRWSPHLTLGRIRKPRPLPALDWETAVPGANQPISITAVHLYQSQLRPSGPIYTQRHSALFN